MPDKTCYLRMCFKLILCMHELNQSHQLISKACPCFKNYLTFWLQEGKEICFIWHLYQAHPMIVYTCWLLFSYVASVGKCEAELFRENKNKIQNLFGLNQFDIYYYKYINHISTIIEPIPWEYWILFHWKQKLFCGYNASPLVN